MARLHSAVILIPWLLWSPGCGGDGAKIEADVEVEHDIVNDAEIEADIEVEHDIVNDAEVEHDAEVEQGPCTIDQSTRYRCGDGSEVPFCACNVPAAACPPECRAVGSADEGWYDSCSGALVKSEKCASCEVRCDAIGSRSEGWYSSCAALIAWAFCATGDWRCVPEPWAACTGSP